MKKEDLIVYGMAGAAVLLIAKATGMQLPKLSGLQGQAKTFAQSIWRPLNPLDGESYNPANPGDYIWNNDLMNGTVSDYYNNDSTSYNTPTISQIIDDVLVGNRSVIMNPGYYAYK